MNHYNELLSVLLCRKQQADNKLLNVSGKKHYTYIVGKGGLYYPFSVSPPPPPFPEIQDVPTFHRSITKTKVLNNSCNKFVYHFCPKCILILEECLQKWWNANLNAFKCFLINFMKRGCEFEKGILLLETVTYNIAIKERVTCIITMETIMCIMHCKNTTCIIATETLICILQ